MAIARDTDAKRVKPLEGAIVRRFTAGAAVAAGQVVAMQSDGFVDPANTTAAAQQVAGIAIQAVAAGERADVVVFGPIVCLTGATPGATLHASNTAGEPAESAGTNAGIVGFVESATVAFVRPVSA
ncbi:MAG: hypothetical protein M9896_19300 [Candidatus Promineofilum sp.]|uniref:hypothetical protein n=1 Tax=Promineifilum sp. TaxID=2664178 RepID=UPI002411FDC4|nr:hypothetical protein [Promineifilum sp.]